MNTNASLRNLTSRLALTVGLFSILAIGDGIAQPASATPTCGDHTAIVDKLADAYQEFRTSVMVDSQGNLVEVYSNLDTGTWTLLVTRPRGGTCVVSSGGNFINTVSDHVVGEPA